MRYTPHRVFLAALLVTSSFTWAPAWAQMHKVSKPEQVVRAVGVYEWTGDFAKPTASRLIPVSLFIEGKLEDAGVYIARPVPFALLSGNVYELQAAGIDKGFLDLAYAKHLQATTSTGDLAYDDGWFGYGTVKPLTAPRRTVSRLKPSKTLPVLTSSNDSNRPHLTTKTGGDSTSSSGTDQSNPTSKPDTSSTSTASTNDPDRPTMKRRSSDTDNTTSSTGTTASGSTPADDPDRPTMKRRDSSADNSDSSTTQTGSTGTATTTGSTPADDPDRPTMTRRTPSDTTTPDSGSTTASGSAPSDDPDRPTLKRHTPEEAKKARNNNDFDTVTGTSSLNDDPDRPNLHHGKPTSAMTESDLPKLVGIPSNLHQMVAVSDAANRDVHPFALEWDDATQHAAVLQKMQDMARAQLAAYAATPATPKKAAAPTPKPAAKTTTPVRTHHPTTPAPAPVPLLDEELKAYTLSYGGAATYIYSAHTAGTGAALRYVTIVAQADGLGALKPAIQSVTDAAHLDRSPQMKFVDVVDAEASNRASLLFELRGQSSRQFGLYRVIASHSDQIFLTGTTE